MNQWLRLDAVLILAAVIGCTKVLHEIGHALTCKRFGGECHQIGPMLLVFTPALYCDTSDSWMLPSRWQRAAVGMAGIATEVLLAAIATFVWVSTAPGLVHYIAMNVMLVCSVSTLLFNANPLLRYDGYYVLSDLCDVPNLGEKSRRLLAGHTNKLIFGFDEMAPELMTASARFWMLTYAVLAAMYRWGLTLLILWFVSLVLRPYRLESIGRLLCLFAAAGLLFTLLRAPAQFLGNPARRKQIQMKRTMISMLAIAVLITLGFYPLPSGVSTSARIIPRGETPIYITTPGLLRTVSKLPGETVIEGEQIATLVNHDVQLRYLSTLGRYETQKQIVESIRRSALDTPEAANDLPGQEALLGDLKKQLETHESRRDGLVIRAPASGKLIVAPRLAKEQGHEHRLISWSGYPTDEQNQDCFMEPGHELMSVATDEHWNAELILNQSEVQRVALGAKVKLALEAMPEKKFIGKVTEISRAQWTAELNAERRDDPGAARRDKPPSTSYVVLVELEPSAIPLVTAASAQSRIEAPSISVFGRASRFLNGLLRFR
jgi:putative peptide zinc metalloprotease protein